MKNKLKIFSILLVFIIFFETAVSNTLKEYQSKLRSIEKSKQKTQQKIVEVKKTAKAGLITNR